MGAEATPASDIDPTEVVADPGLLALVLRNLLENALRHGEGRAIEVALEGVARGARPRTRLRQREEPMRSFERSPRRQAGPRLGLALVRHICTACGWTVHAANRPDGGACLTIDFGAGAGSGSVQPAA